MLLRSNALFVGRERQAEGSARPSDRRYDDVPRDEYAIRMTSARVAAPNPKARKLIAMAAAYRRAALRR